MKYSLYLVKYFQCVLEIELENCDCIDLNSHYWNHGYKVFDKCAPMILNNLLILILQDINSEFVNHLYYFTKKKMKFLSKVLPKACWQCKFPISIHTSFSDIKAFLYFNL